MNVKMYVYGIIDYHVGPLAMMQMQLVVISYSLGECEFDKKEREMR